MDQHDNATTWEVEAARRREVITADFGVGRMDGGLDVDRELDRRGRLVRLVARFHRAEPERHDTGRATVGRRYRVRTGG